MKQLEIVVAEDDLDDRMLLESVASDAGIANPLRFVDDGVELFSYLNRRQDTASEVGGGLPALVLLDLNMPKMNGREVLRRRLEDGLFRQVPFVVLTTSTSKTEEIEMYMLGADWFVSKPLRMRDFRACLERVRRDWLEY